MSEKARITALLQSIVTDVQAMRQPLGIEEHIDAEYPSNCFFGGFQDYFDNSSMSMVNSSAGVRVFWPNLAILADQAEQLLSELSASETLAGNKSVSDVSSFSASCCKVLMTSNEYGTEIFDYESEEDARKGFARLMESCKQHNDGVQRSLYLLLSAGATIIDGKEV